MSDEHTIRPFATTEEYWECVALQEETWGVGFSERVSPAILKVAQILGGVSAGAYDADQRLVGFVFGLTGLRNGEMAHWSDMLAVRPEARDAGLGRKLKAYQREEVLSCGVHTMYWTFDPLQSRNAYLNLTKLGAVVREYEENMYGDSDSLLHRGIGTDRFIALWLLTSDRVKERLADVTGEVPDGSTPPVGPGGSTGVPSALAAEAGPGHPTPGRPALDLSETTFSVDIPSDIGAVMSHDLELAVRWRAATRAAFRHYLGSGYEVREFERGDRISKYLMTRIDE